MTAVFSRRTLHHTLSKIFAALLVTICYLLLNNVSSFAQTTATNSAAPNHQSIINNTYIPPSSPQGASVAFYNFSHALSCILVGQSSIAPCLEYKTIKDISGNIQSIPVLSSTNTNGGVLGFTTSALTSLYTEHPLDEQQYLAYLGNQLGVTETHAQVVGSANSVLSSVFSLWQVSVQFAYILMIIVFIVVGLMVMFRHRLNPQTVVSIQMALPGLVIGLVLITFSYFLASLISDIAFLGTNVVGWYFALADSSPTSTTDALSSLGRENVLSIMSKFTDTTGKFDWAPSIQLIFNNLNGTSKTTLENVAAWIAAQTSAPLTSGVGALVGLGASAVSLGTRGGWGRLKEVGNLAAGANVGEVIGNIAGQAGVALWTKADPSEVLSFAVGWILFFILLFTMFRLLFSLLKNYLSIIFNTILAPFIFLAASFPGRQSMFTDWVRNMLCAALSFPAVIAMFYFAYFILTGTTNIYATTKKTPPPGSAFSFDAVDPGAGRFMGSWFLGKNRASGPSFIGQGTMPLFGGLSEELIRYLLAYAALIATPSIPDLICKVLGKQGAAGQMIGGAVIGGWGGGLRQAQQYGSAALSPGIMGATPGSYYRNFAKTAGFGEQKHYDLSTVINPKTGEAEEQYTVRSVALGDFKKAFAPPELIHPQHHVESHERDAAAKRAANPAYLRKSIVGATDAIRQGRNRTTLDKT